MPATRTRRRPANPGNRAESERLKPLFLSFVGTQRSVAQVCRMYDLPYMLIQKWMGGHAILADDLQQRLRGDLGLGAP